MLFLSVLIALGLITSSVSADNNCKTVVQRAVTVADYMIKHYNKTSGMIGPTDGKGFNGGTWWTTGAMHYTLSSLMDYVPQKRSEVSGILDNTFYAAQKYILQFEDNSGDKLKQLQNKPAPLIHGSFYNGFYDDEGWWSTAWIRAYDITRNPAHLKAAEDIFSDMTGGFDKQRCGGLYWAKGKKYVSSISNELFFYTAAGLANRAGDKQKYISWTQKEWDWFKNSKLKNTDNKIVDGLDQNCKGTGTVWTYNQGVILNALVEGYKATNDKSMLEYANEVAQATIKTMSKNGILRDGCEPNCGGDQAHLGDQFKGIFIRGLSMLQTASPKDEYKKFIVNNADTLWNKARDPSTGEIGEVWSGPVETPTINSMAAAFDCLVEAIPNAGCTVNES